MDEVMVVLAGDPSSLATLSQRFSSSRLTVIHESGGDTGYLKSSDFDPSTDDAKILDAAERLIDVANGIMRLRRPRVYRPVDVRPAVVRDDEQGNRTVSTSIRDTAPLDVTEEVTIKKITAEGVTVEKFTSHSASAQPPLEGIAVALLGDDAMWNAMRFYSYRDNWPFNLYNVYEILGLDVWELNNGRKSTFSDNKKKLIEDGWKVIGSKGWAAGADTIRFRQTVHNPEALAGEARHAVQTKPPPVDPMFEEEAKEFIGAALRQWLQWKRAGKL